MPGTKAGGAKAAATNKAKYGDDFYARIGALGGRNGTTGGFYANRKLAAEAGRIGGKISKRGRSYNKLPRSVRNTAVTNSDRMPPYEEEDRQPKVRTQ